MEKELTLTQRILVRAAELIGKKELGDDTN